MPNNLFITRHYANLDDYYQPAQVLIIYGARQVGKTTLVRHYLQTCPYKYKIDSGDDIVLQAMLTEASFNTIKDYVADYELIVIDEAQKIAHIGQALKIMVDQFPHLRLIVTGSSAFELAGQIGEPLTGRKRTLTLYPIAQMELLKHLTPYELKQKLEAYLIYGSYPQIITTSTLAQKGDLIREITNSYLLKDILALDRIKNSKTLLDLLRLLAFQLGSEVSHHELAKQLSIDAKTVTRYLDILEKGFVIYNLRGFSRNLRKEITKKSKYYFYDNGIRNALIANFNPLNLRDDIGKLWENFLFIERLKKQAYKPIYANNYFWRTWDKKEIDFIEEREGHLFGYEFKWNEKVKSVPHEWLQTYHHSHVEIINPLNYLEFIT